jgi:hypothetical protein
MKRVISILILIGACLQAISAQTPKAEIIDQFGRLNCCDFEARIGGLVWRLDQQPGATGYAVISGDTIFQRLYLERFILNAIARQHKDPKRIRMVRALGEGAGPMVELSIVPEGAEMPEFREISLDFTFPWNRKPFLFEDNEDVGICPVYNLDLGHVSEFLSANPTARGHIVISSRINAKEYRSLRATLLKNAREANISTNRLKFFRGKTRYNSTVEIWLVPGRMRAVLKVPVTKKTSI